MARVTGKLSRVAGKLSRVQKIVNRDNLIGACRR